jgi:hypothetical protein
MIRKKLTIIDIRRIARQKKGKCLSNSYVNIDHKLKWRCKEGHIWFASPYSVINRKSWCQKCKLREIAESRRLGIEKMQKLAKKKRGRCLSTKYFNSKTPLKWQCKKGHFFEQTPDKVKRGRWCPECSSRKRHTLEEMKKIAEKYGGKCLSKKYINTITKLEFQCIEGHRWKAKPSDILKGHWCFRCRIKTVVDRQRHTIEYMRKLARMKKGKCLSITYVNVHTKLKWQCKKGHTWKAMPMNIIKNKWCPDCAKEKRSRLFRKYDIKDMQRYARERGGRCLSKKYVNLQQKLLWQCKYGHTWEAVPPSIMHGTWCPECSSGRHEKDCRIKFEQIFGSSFPKCKPKWLKNKRGNTMELDGYSKRLGVAFEYHGKQHYEKSRFYPTNLKQRKEDDKQKRKLCKEHCIVLIEVPYTIKYNELETFIRKEYKKKKRA